MMTDRKKKIIGSIAVAAFFLALLIASFLLGEPMIRFFQNPEQFREVVDGWGFTGKIVFVALVALQVVIAFIPGEPLEIAAGYAFGSFWGTILCLLGITLGSLIVFLFVRTAGKRILEFFFPIEKISQMKFLQNSERTNLLLFYVMFLPGTPKDLLTYFAPLLDLSLSRFLIISFFARVPSVVTSTVGGNALGEKKYVFAIVTFAVTFLISILGIYLYHTIRKKYEARREEQKEKNDA